MMNQLITPRILLLFAVLLFTGCRSVTPAEEDRERTSAEMLLDGFFEGSDTFNQSITGFMLYDPEADSVWYGRDKHRFFTPASNIKTFTLYASLKLLPDTLPSIRYSVRNDTLFFRGTGDPSFLNPGLENNKVLEFLKSREETLAYYDAHFADDHYGAGWPWDWYPQAYAPQKSPMPVYGNMMRLQTEQVSMVRLNEERPVKPAFFEKYINDKGWNSGQTELVKRDQLTNLVNYSPRSDTVKREQLVPFVYDPELITAILADTLGRDVVHSNAPGLDFSDTIYGTPAKDLYKQMMHDSDNFIAEQLLLMISDREFNEMETARAIRFALQEVLDEYSDEFRWADGSGLTRYNLVTPRAMTALLKRLLDEYSEEAILAYFPAGGQSGTLRSWFRPAEGAEPYLYAKTGTLRNNTSLAGYLYTDSGRLLIFTFLNNNYVVSNNQMRAEMERALHLVKQNY